MIKTVQLRSVFEVSRKISWYFFGEAVLKKTEAHGRALVMSLDLHTRVGICGACLVVLWNCRFDSVPQFSICSGHFLFNDARDLGVGVDIFLQHKWIAQPDRKSVV